MIERLARALADFIRRREDAAERRRVARCVLEQAQAKARAAAEAASGDERLHLARRIFAWATVFVFTMEGRWVFEHWWGQRQREREERRRTVEHGIEIQRRYREFESNCAKFTRSPWIRSLIASPMFQENVRAPGSPRKISVSHPAKETGRGYIDDLLALEYSIRFRHFRWAWRGIFAAMALDVTEAVYTEEREKIYHELLATCPDERLSLGRHRGIAAVQGMASGMIQAGTRSMRLVTRPQEPRE